MEFLLEHYQVSQDKASWIVGLGFVGVILLYQVLRILLPDVIRNYEMDFIYRLKRLFTFKDPDDSIADLRSNFTHSFDTNIQNLKANDNLYSIQERSYEQSKLMQSAEDYWLENKYDLELYLEVKPWLFREVVLSFKNDSKIIDFTAWLVKELNAQLQNKVASIVELSDQSTQEEYTKLNSKTLFDALIVELKRLENIELRNWSRMMNKKDLEFLASIPNEKLVMSFAMIDSLKTFSVYVRCQPIEIVCNLMAQLSTVRRLENLEAFTPSLKEARVVMKSFVDYLGKSLNSNSPSM